MIINGRVSAPRLYIPPKKIHPYKMDYVSGEKIQQLCDVYCGFQTDFVRNPKIASESKKHIDLLRLLDDWDNPSLIFCYSNALLLFMNKLHLFKNPFVLVSHNEDANITSDYLPIASHPLVIRWFAQNVMFNHPKLFMIPIGLANSMWVHGSTRNMDVTRQKSFTKEKHTYFYFNTNTNKSERLVCKTILESKGLKFGSEQSHQAYLENLAQFKFAISPPGNGIDCHRIWECFYVNTIPVLVKSYFTDMLRKYLPCVVLNSWNEYNESELLKHYDELQKELQQKQIYLNMNYYKYIISTIVKVLNPTYNPHTSYSNTDAYNNSLDHILDSIIADDNKDGFFIELGANDGITQSNTAYFEKHKSWKGVLVEPSYNAYQKCKVNRPASACYNYACVSRDCKMDEITGDFNGSLMSSIDGSRLMTQHLVTVKTTTLEKLLDIHKPTEINLLSLDVEGYELNVLNGLNFEKYKPNFILIEIYNKDYESIVNMLEAQNYTLLGNISNYTTLTNPHWDGTHNDYLFISNTYIEKRIGKSTPNPNVELIVYTVSQTRLQEMNKQFSDLNITYPFTFIDGITPHNSSIPLIPQDKDSPESPGTICCLLSFIKALTYFVTKSNAEYAIFMEDDAAICKTGFEKHVEKAIQSYKNHTSDYDYISLGYNVGSINPDDVTSEIVQHDDCIYWDFYKMKIHTDHGIAAKSIWGTEAQLISRKTALFLYSLLGEKSSVEEIYTSVKTHTIKYGRYTRNRVRLQLDAIIPAILKQAIMYPPLVIERSNIQSLIIPNCTHAHTWLYGETQGMYKLNTFYSY